LWAHVLSVSLIVLTGLIFLLDPLLIKWLIDRVLPKKDLRLLLLAATGFFLIYITRLGLSGVAGLVYFRTVQDLVFTIRLSLLHQMNRLSADYHETTPVGEKVYRMEQDVDQVAELGSSLVPFAFQALFNAVFMIGAMMILDWKLTCFVFPLMPLFFVFRRYFADRLHESSDEARHQSNRESSFLQEHLCSIIQIQLLRQETGQTQAFIERATARVKALKDRNLTEILFVSCYMGAIALATIAVVAYGGYQAFIGVLTVGGLVAFYGYMARLFDPLHAGVEIYSRLNRVSSSIQRILEVIETRPSVAEKTAAIRFSSPVRGYVELEDVSFSYRGEHPVLCQLNLRIEAGEKVALVGVSGSGKSTLAKLIARLYDVKQGSIYVDGIDVRDVRLDSLRSTICYVMQEPVLFDMTLKENLLLGKRYANEQELRHAIDVADLDDLLCRLSAGWDTRIGPRGNMLSGGERQRVALARAVLQDPALLLLDESTSALDAPSEQGVFRNLARHFPNQTIIFISHRIAALKWVDDIVVLNQGVIEEQGTHDELLRRSSLYDSLHAAPGALSTSQGLNRPSGSNS